MHPKKLEMDEAADYPDAGWVELGETLKFGEKDATWRAHGVSRGVRDRYYKQTQPESGWTVHRITGMHRQDWSAEERNAKAELYGSRDQADYRRNILGLHGDAQSPLFVLHRLMQCVDEREDSFYNSEYRHVRISDEKLIDTAMPIETLLEFPLGHKAYERTWAGMDVGMTNHPSEILIYGEEYNQRKGTAKANDWDFRLKLLTRIHLQRISAPDQRAVLEAVWDFYKPQAIAMDRTGLGLPIYQEIVEAKIPGFSQSMRGYNFSEKLVIAYEENEDDPDEPIEVRANVLEFSSDMLRLMVDQRQMLLPWDIDLIREFQGQTYQVNRSSTDPYGKKKFNQGKFHALDAARMAVLGYKQSHIEQLLRRPDDEPIFDAFLQPGW